MKQTPNGKVLEVPLTMGGVNAMLENSRYIGEAVLEEAEQFALQSSKRTGYKPAVTRDDIENAIAKVKKVDIY